MFRNFNTDQHGRYFSEKEKVAVWQKAAAAPGLPPNQYRLDICGAVIEWSKFGTTIENGNGWEIDHIYPVSLGGDDSLSNLQALQWQHNRKKGDSTQGNYCFIKRAAS